MVQVENGMPPRLKAERSDMPVMMPGSAIGRMTRSEIDSRPKKRERTIAAAQTTGDIAMGEPARMGMVAWSMLHGVAALVVGTLAAAVFEVLQRKRLPPRAQAWAALAVWLLLAMAVGATAWVQGSTLALLGALGWTVPMTALACARLWPQLQALRTNSWGICTGRAQAPQPDQTPSEKALIEWLHQGIQRAAGRERHDPPLTFSDLWAVRRPGESADVHGHREPGIELLMFSTNVTLARPVVLPSTDRNTRLFFCRDEWSRFFPPTLLDALWEASTPYAPADDSDPPASNDNLHLRELPAGGMPVAVAARLSLSFPLLFSCIPVHAIDYEMPRAQRRLRRRLLTDGGLCTNFPIHLFDTAHPRWPTFGLMLGRRIAAHDAEAVWLPDHHRAGRADNWSRGVPGAGDGPEPGPVQGLLGLLGGMLTAALHWNDHLTSRLAPVRNRVLRIALRPGEGQLNIAMPGATILRMAHEYGTAGGRLLVRHFAGEHGQPSAVWREHLYVRAVSEIRMLGRHLRGYARAAAGQGFSPSLASLLSDASRGRPLRAPPGRVPDLAGAGLTPSQARALEAATQAIVALERALDQDDTALGPYEPQPPMQMQMRARI